MVVLKNALRNVMRSKGRNILIGMIIFVISLSLCVGLSIRQAAANARENALQGMTITGQISVDRGGMMRRAEESRAAEGENAGGFDKESFGGFSESLSVEELQKYAQASTVNGFYYTLSSSLDATGTLEPVSSSSQTSSSESSTVQGGRSSGEPGRGGGNPMGSNGDFSLIGYSGDQAMTAFQDGSASILSGVMFTEGTEAFDCVISQELATYNSLAVGSSIVLANPDLTTETYTLHIVGIYQNTGQTDEKGMGKMVSAADPSNEIYMSYPAVKKMVDQSAATATTTTDSSGRQTSTALSSQTKGTYLFSSVADYQTFAQEVYTLGLSEDYQVSSADVNQYEQSLVPLETLSTIAAYFLLVIVAIGGLILVVLNIFSIRERKYEIGVLTAIGMKKAKVALQFIAEMLLVTLMAVIIGGAVGAVSSVPIANTLLQQQVSAQQEQHSSRRQAFGREMGGGADGGSGDTGAPQEAAGGGNRQAIGGAEQAHYFNQITASVNLSLLLQLLGICILLAMAASAVSVGAIMRYDPLRILSNRD